jgi:PAS domain S-box-containing protein
LSDTIKPSCSLHGDIPAAASPQALLDQKELAATAFERTRMPMVVTDPRQPDNPIVLANEAFLSFSGYTAQEVIGRNCRFLQGPATSPSAIAQLRAGLADQRDINVELLNYRKDGSVVWVQLHISPIRDDSGEVAYYFGSQLDVTEQRRIEGLEASEHRLMMEVDHRARNVLALVNGIVRLSRSDDPARYAASIQQRVQALASAHTLLADVGWQRVPLEALLRQQVAPFGGGRVTFSGPELLLPADRVQPVALMIHELIANTASHGALTQPGGALAVSWTVDPQGGGFELRWEESGGRAPGDAPVWGFGMAMIKGTVESQLRGQVRFDWRPAGLTVIVTAPPAPMPA